MLMRRKIIFFIDITNERTNETLDFSLYFLILLIRRICIVLTFTQIFVIRTNNRQRNREIDTFNRIRQIIALS